MLGTSVRVGTAITADEYRRFTAGCPSALVQHTWEWRDVVTFDGRDVPVTLVARDDDGEVCGLLPAYRCDGEYGALLISVPQPGGYGGVVVDPVHPRRTDIHQALLEAFSVTAREQGCVLATISTPPFRAELALYEEHFAPDFVRENFHQYIDLAAPLEHAGAAQPYDVAKYVKRAAQARVKFGLEVTFDDNDARFAAWDAIHEARMCELGVPRLPREFLEAIRTHVIGAGLGTMCYVLQGGTVVAGCMFTGHGDVLDCFMLSGGPDASRTLATSVLVVAALDWARRAGYRWFNWQSSSSRTSGVYQFKQKWGSLEGRHHYLTRITGDIGALRHAPLDRVRAAYPWHYVMPYEQFATSSPTTTPSAGA